MISQVQKLTSVQQIENLKLTEVTSSGKPLPQQNSIVNINILLKNAGSYRLLIDGSVFQASLPVNVNPGETLIAKVINTSPFTLSLDQLLPHNISDLMLSQLLLKLGIRNTGGAKRLLKIMAEARKPVVKSRFEKVLDLIEKENLRMSDEQLSLFIQVLASNEQQYDTLDRGYAALFEVPAAELAGRIFTSVKNLQHRIPHAELLAAMEDAFIIDTGEIESEGGLLLKNKNSAQMEFLNQLNGYLGDKKMPEQLKIEVSELLTSLALFMMYKANSSRIGRYPELMIIRGEDGLELFQYEFDMSEINKNSRSSFDLNMSPESLGRINVNGFVSGSNLKADFTSAEETKAELEAAADQLEMNLANNLRLNPVLNFHDTESESGRKKDGPRGVNASV